jgi:hypothetical protein
MTISIRDKVKSKPSVAITYAIKGLERLATKPGYCVNLHTYGRAYDGICYGCAATAAIQEIAGKDLDESNIGNTQDRAKALGLEERELMAFESAINLSRSGRINKLLIFCGLGVEENTDIISEVHDFWDSVSGTEIHCALTTLKYAGEALRLEGL